MEPNENEKGNPVYPNAPWYDGLTERERKEIDFARAYAEHYAHGTDGHSRLMLIAKLTDLLYAGFRAPGSLLTPAETPKQHDGPSNPKKPHGMA